MLFVNLILQPGKHNILIQYVDASSIPQKMVTSAILSNEIFYGSSLIENHSVCVPSTTVDCNLFLNHRNKKVVGGNCNVPGYYKNASAPDLEGVVLCNPF